MPKATKTEDEGTDVSPRVARHTVCKALPKVLDSSTAREPQNVVSQGSRIPASQCMRRKRLSPIVLYLHKAA